MLGSVLARVLKDLTLKSRKVSYIHSQVRKKKTLLDLIKPGKTCLPILHGWVSNTTIQKLGIYDFKTKQFQECLVSITSQVTKEEN